MDLLVIVGLLELVFLLFFFMGMVGATDKLNKILKRYGLRSDRYNDRYGQVKTEDLVWGDKYDEKKRRLAERQKKIENLEFEIREYVLLNGIDNPKFKEMIEELKKL